MTSHLLDTNLLIALLRPAHDRHTDAVRWFKHHRGRGWATCPFTEAGFIRIVSSPAFSRDAVLPREAMQVPSANTAAEDHVFWTDDLPFAEAVAFAGVRLVGHRQVIDAYVLGLAVGHGGALATLDESIAVLAAPGAAGTCRAGDRGLTTCVEDRPPAVGRLPFRGHRTGEAESGCSGTALRAAENGEP